MHVLSQSVGAVTGYHMLRKGPLGQRGREAVPDNREVLPALGERAAAHCPDETSSASYMEGAPL